ncbi:Hypothetical predicted protein [Marmota monax]|uniref:Uncharacterized protein n=1 Tax=Marmota monax TaxID=9995 RepID=A0A5E4A6U6_MARMO|nr:hypothetical protein GHT09_005638 [Marmota monax]VTJ52715.1 Hypothetical predicted protein [Marmota monax]
MTKGHTTNRSLRQVLVRLGSAGMQEAPLSSRSSQAQEDVSPVPAAGFRPHVSAPPQLPSRPQPVQIGVLGPGYVHLLMGDHLPLPALPCSPICALAPVFLFPACPSLPHPFLKV